MLKKVANLCGGGAGVPENLTIEIEGGDDSDEDEGEERRWTCGRAQ